MLAIVLATAIFGWLAVSIVVSRALEVVASFSPAFARTSPGVLTIVELKKTSSWLLAEGVKPDGVTLCAWARPARLATNNDVARYIMDFLRWGEWSLDTDISIRACVCMKIGRAHV